ncbi:endoplasmic reticulum membrane-associated RNA degradation protein-like [Mytilus edulis]
MAELLLTALSPKVRRLITEVGVHNESSPVSFLSSSKIICWDMLRQVLPDECLEDTNSDDYFEKCIFGLGFLFKECEHCVQEMTVDDLLHHFSDLISWTCQEQVIKECFRLLKTDKLTDNYLALLLVTSCLERALGDVYLLENTICPSMLKDILSSSTLKKIFGPTVVQVLRAVIGPPISLNLRNVIWHGFPTEQEISKRYTCFLLIVLPSLDQYLQGDIPHRSPIIFHQDSQYAEILPDINDMTSEEMKILMQTSSFIPKYQLTLWNHCIDLYNTDKPGLAMVLLLPLLEHALRCQFSIVNNCPGRTITAEATTLYTTLDEILDQYVTENVENKLPSEIGESIMEILMDLLTYPSGPRIRDRLSHGEADVFTFPKSLCTAVVIVTVHITSKYQPADDCCKKPWLKRIASWVNQYEALFHPVSLVKSKIKEVTKIAGQFNKHIEYTYTLDQRTHWNDKEIIDSNFQENDLITKETTAIINLLCNKWNIRKTIQEVLNRVFSPFADCSVFIGEMLNIKIQTLFRYKDSGSGNQDGEIINLLLRIVTECETVITQVFTALQTRQEQLKNKTLRSRQRNNLQSLINCCFIIHQSVHLIVWLTTCDLVTIETKKLEEKKHIKCLKMVLQFTENLRTYTNSENNKWMECVNLSIKTMDKLKQFIT